MTLFRMMLLVSFFVMCGEGYAYSDYMSLRCMLTCTKNDCATSPKQFAWCMAQCASVLPYSDLTVCAEAFFESLREKEQSCALQLGAAFKDGEEGARLFCEVTDSLFLKKRLDEKSVRRGLFRRALQEVQDLRDFVRKVGSKDK